MRVVRYLLAALFFVWGVGILVYSYDDFRFCLSGEWMSIPKFLIDLFNVAVMGFICWQISPPG
jgi:hypothetical protein